VSMALTRLSPCAASRYLDVILPVFWYRVSIAEVVCSLLGLSSYLPYSEAGSLLVPARVVTGRQMSYARATRSGLERRPSAPALPRGVRVLNHEVPPRSDKLEELREVELLVPVLMRAVLNDELEPAAKKGEPTRSPTRSPQVPAVISPLRRADKPAHRQAHALKSDRRGRTARSLTYRTFCPPGSTRGGAARRCPARCGGQRLVRRLCRAADGRPRRRRRRRDGLAAAAVGLLVVLGRCHGQARRRDSRTSMRCSATPAVGGRALQSTRRPTARWRRRLGAVPKWRS
jgi:hypothetical protein